MRCASEVCLVWCASSATWATCACVCVHVVLRVLLSAVCTSSLSCFPDCPDFSLPLQPGRRCDSFACRRGLRRTIFLFLSLSFSPVLLCHPFVWSRARQAFCATLSSGSLLQQNCAAQFIFSSRHHPSPLGLPHAKVIEMRRRCPLGGTTDCCLTCS